MFSPGGRPADAARHEKDAEESFVVAVVQDEEIDFSGRFCVRKPLSLSALFEQYAEIAPHANEVNLPYVVDGND